MSIDLPRPEPDARVVSENLTERIRSRIDEKGAISLAEYWDLCLYTPGLGYYAAGAQKFGASGDFITAPELGPQFAECLADWFSQGAQQDTILELGAGTGALASDLLIRLEALDSLPANYLILDRSADLIERQRHRLKSHCPHLMNRVQWITETPSQAWSGAIIGNEVVDAIAAERVIKGEEGWNHLMITGQGGHFGWSEVESSTVNSDMTRITAGLPWSLQPGYVTEYQPMLTSWLESITEHLTAGQLLLVDYGYMQHEFYHPQRSQGTLIGHYRHRAVDDVFLWPGLVDLSVSVDFTALANAAEYCGWQVDGVQSQASFLLEHGLVERLESKHSESDVDALARLKEFKMLTMPSEMGDRFRVLTASRGQHD